MEKKRQLARFFLYLLMLLPLLLLRDVTPNNELRYLSIADEAIRDGHLFAFYNHGVAYADKPPLYLWLIMISKLIFGSHITWILSLFSIIPAFITIWVLDKWCANELSVKQRIAAEAALLSSVYFLASGIVIRMDMMMTMFITLSLYTFYRMYKGDNRIIMRILFPVYIFMAVFSKGPVGFLVPLICTPVFLLIYGKIKTWGRYWGAYTWGILIFLCALWFTGVYIDGGKEYLDNLLFHQTIDRAVNSFHHKEPFYYYLLSVWYAVFPWSILSLGITVIALCCKQKISELAGFFICTWITIFIMMSSVSSKIVIYILPCFGFMIYGTFLLIENFRFKKFINAAILIPIIIFILIPPAFILSKHFITIPYSEYISLWMLIPLFAGNLYALLLVINKNIYKAITSVAVSLYLTIFVAGFSVEKLNPVIGYRSICEQAISAAKEKGIDRFVLATDEQGRCIMRRGENIDVYLGKEAEMIPENIIENNLAQVLKDSKGIIVFIRKNKKAKFEVYESTK